jgi:hypothetical protein
LLKKYIGWLCYTLWAAGLRDVWPAVGDDDLASRYGSQCGAIIAAAGIGPYTRRTPCGA